MFASYAYTYEAIYYWFGGIEEMRITVILQSSADDISYIIFEGSDLLISGGIGTGFVVRVLERFIIASAPIEDVEFIPCNASTLGTDWTHLEVTKELLYLSGLFVVVLIFFEGLYAGCVFDALGLVSLGVGKLSMRLFFYPSVCCPLCLDLHKEG